MLLYPPVYSSVVSFWLHASCLVLDVWGLHGACWRELSTLLGWWESSRGNKSIVFVLVGKVHLTQYCHNYMRASNIILKVHSFYLRSADPDMGSDYLWYFPRYINPLHHFRTDWTANLHATTNNLQQLLYEGNDRHPTQLLRFHPLPILYQEVKDLLHCGLKEFVQNIYAAVQIPHQ